MRQLRYNVAMSLDGFIGGPEREYDWIVMDPGFDWKGMYAQFDTLVMGRRTYDTMRERGMSPKGMGMKALVISTTLPPDQHGDVRVCGHNVVEAVAALKSEPGKDIWLCGGALLFRTLLDAGLVDTVEVTVMPVLLGSGVPLVPTGRRSQLRLIESKTGPGGVVMLKYGVMHG